MTLLLAVAITPTYLRYIGAEGYGVLGFLGALLAILGVADLGLSVAINRELSRHLALAVPAEVSRNLLRTIEVPYIAIGGILGIGTISLSSWIAERFLDGGSIGDSSPQSAVVLMGVIIILRWPVALYGGALRGRDRQASWNAIVVTEAVTRTAISVFVLVWVSQSVVAVLTGFVVCSALQLAVLATVAWKAMPRAPSTPRFDLACVRRLGRFTSKVAVIALLAALLKQADTMMVAAFLPVADLGYYVLAWSICSVLLILPTTIFLSVMPRLSMYAASDRQGELRSLYHKSSQLVAYCVAPIGIGLALFSHDALEVWTGQGATADRADVVVSVLAIAFLFNALTQLPVALQLATGRVKIIMLLNGAGAAITLPTVYLGIAFYGIAGAGGAWLAFNVMSSAVGPFFMHRSLLAGDFRQWALRDSLLFVGLACVTMLTAYCCARLVGGLPAVVAFGALGLVCYAALASRWCEPAHGLVQRMISLSRRRTSAP